MANTCMHTENYNGSFQKRQRVVEFTGTQISAFWFEKSSTITGLCYCDLLNANHFPIQWAILSLQLCPERHSLPSRSPQSCRLIMSFKPCVFHLPQCLLTYFPPNTVHASSTWPFFVLRTLRKCGLLWEAWPPPIAIHYSCRNTC